MERTHLIERVGGDNIFATEDMALDAIYQRLGESEHRPLRGQVAMQTA
jgi:hypothetical protein